MGTGPISSKTSSLRARLLRFGRQESARTPGDPITEISGDIAALIDAAAECRAGSRNVDGSKDAGSQQKRVRVGSIRELPRDAAPVVDSANNCGSSSRNVDGDEGSVGCPHVAVRDARQDIRSCDLADLVDAECESLGCPRHIDLGESAILVQKSVIDSDVIDDVSHHLALIVDSENPCERNTGKVNRLKLSVPQEETMGRSLSANRPVIILPDNISSLVDSARSSLQVSRNIDLAESALRQQEPMGYTVRAGESTNHLARAVDSLWSGCDGSG